MNSRRLEMRFFVIYTLFIFQHVIATGDLASKETRIVKDDSSEAARKAIHERVSNPTRGRRRLSSEADWYSAFKNAWTDQSSGEDSEISSSCVKRTNNMVMTYSVDDGGRALQTVVQPAPTSAPIKPTNAPFVINEVTDGTVIELTNPNDPDAGGGGIADSDDNYDYDYDNDYDYSYSYPSKSSKSYDYSHSYPSKSSKSYDYSHSYSSSKYKKGKGKKGKGKKSKSDKNRKGDTSSKKSKKSKTTSSVATRYCEDDDDYIAPDTDGEIQAVDDPTSAPNTMNNEVSDGTVIVLTNQHIDDQISTDTTDDQNTVVVVSDDEDGDNDSGTGNDESNADTDNTNDD